MKRRTFGCLGILASLAFFLSLSTSSYSVSGGLHAIRIAEKAQMSNPSILEAGSREFCLLQYDNGQAFTYFPNWNPGDRNVIYFDPEVCGVPYAFPFQITDVEFSLFNHAEVESTQVRFNLWTMGDDLCDGPQTEIWTSSVYTITTFYPDWALVSFTDSVCADEPFFFAVEYASGETGSIPSLIADDQQEMVDTCYQWMWYDPDSPPWWEWNRFWNDPDPGWLMLRLKGETYSLACDTGWIWLSENGYAPSGAPDVDENQSGWVGRCGPVAAGNCLAWYGTNGSMGWEIPEFVDTLTSYFATDSTGTEPNGMKSGLDDLFNDFAISGLYTIIWPAPDFSVMAESLEVSQTMVLLLGFWWWDGENWWREGGHYATLSGVKSSANKIGLSDPAKDAAEYDWPGRVRPSDHPPPPHEDTLHNDLLYVSHDIYRSTLTSSVPGNPNWELTDYLELDPEFPRQYTGMNFPPEFDSLYQPAPAGTTFVTAVEYAVMICAQQEHLNWESSYPDYAPSGMPDFDQEQDNWINSETEQFTFSGPVAVANAFWWMDSKFNLPVGSMGDGEDQFPLVRDYLDNLGPYQNWDDHDLWNVDHSATPWGTAGPPPSTPQPFVPGPQSPGGVDAWGELTERLAWQMDTDGQRTGGSQVGTVVQDMDEAIEAWLSFETFATGEGLADSLCVKIYQKPGFADAVMLAKDHEAVVLLLGFWYIPASKWRRVGGHFVTVAGINSIESKVAFSDPFFDNAECGAPGRVLSGSYIPHSPVPHTDSVLHNDPGNVSHDTYDVDFNSPAPAGEWWLIDYPASSDPDSFMSLFYGQNVPQEFQSSTQPYESGYPVYAVVEYAVLIDVFDHRGDVNNNGGIEGGDVIYMINYLFRDGLPPSPLSAGDVNCDGVVTAGDVVFLITYLFRGGPISRCCGP
jgi:hypothetical protein